MSSQIDTAKVLAAIKASRGGTGTNKPSMLDRATVSSLVWFEVDHSAVARAVAQTEELRLANYYLNGQ